MKHYFSVYYSEFDTTKIYEVEADTKEDAEDKFFKNICAILYDSDMTYDDFYSYMEDRDITISYTNSEIVVIK